MVKKYNLSFDKIVSMNSRLMYDALEGGDVDVVTAYTTDGQISAFDLLVLPDPLQALPPYDAVILVAPRRSHDRELMKALKTLVNKFPTELMRTANMQVDVEKKSIRSASAYLQRKAQIRKQK